MAISYNSKFISWQIAILLVVIFLFIRQYAFPELSNYPEKIPDGLFYYSSDELKEIISNYSLAEQSNYIKSSLIFDFIYPFVYASMFFVIIMLIFKALKLKTKWLLLISCMPFISMLLDYIENIGMFYLINLLPDFNENIAQILGWLTFLKWLFIGISIVSAMVVAVYTISYRIRHSVPFDKGKN